MSRPIGIPGVMPQSPLNEARPAIRALVQGRVDRKAEFEGRLGAIAAKMQARRDKGLQPAKSPFVDAALGYDNLPPSGLRPPSPQPRGKGTRRLMQEERAGAAEVQARVPKAVRPGGLVAKYQGSAALDRMLEHEDRERGAE